MKRRGAPTRPSDHRPSETPQHFSRDSDASLYTPRPSSSSSFGGAASKHLTTDKHSMVRFINSYLSSHSFKVSLSYKPLPSAKDVTEVLRFLLSRFDFHSNPSGKKNISNNSFEDDVFLLLKSLNCPHKITKSSLRAPAVPHAFPQMLAVIHWLVQLAAYLDHLSSDQNTSRFSFMKDALMEYAVNSYVSYMKGDDEVVDMLDGEFSDRMENQKGSLVDTLKSLDEEAHKLESELERLKSKPSEKEMYERQRKDLEGDVGKFQEYIASLREANSVTGKMLEEKEKELAAKVEELKRIEDENEELKKKVEAQGINSRDAERMKRELQALEREISETEASRNSWEEKSSHLDSDMRQKLKELEVLSVDCNQALRRLKLGVECQYVLNAKGSTPAEVLGIDYKSTLKPCINELADEIRKSTAAKWDEYIALQQQFKEFTTRIEAKKTRLAALQLHIDERERQFEVIRNQMDEYSSWCTSEAHRIKSEMESEAHNLDIMEREAYETLKAAELKLQEEIRQNEQETQLCAYELFALIDLVSNGKECTEKKIADTKKNLSETVDFICTAHKNTMIPGLSNVD